MPKNARKGDTSRARVAGKRVVELGAGCGGLAGLAFAMLGPAEVLLTDVPAVLPLLRRNAELNLSPASLNGVRWTAALIVWGNAPAALLITPALVDSCPRSDGRWLCCCTC